MERQNINDLQRRLVDELIEKKFIKTKEVEEAFLTVPRHLFLPGVELEKVYSNSAIVTKWDGKMPLSSSSEPAVYAIILEQMELTEGLKILEIGAGTGFNAALMAQITGKNGEVITVDIDKDITDSARANLNSAGYSSVKVICMDGASGYEQEAPYDRIIMTAGVWDINREWFNQLKPGGILLVPMIISFKDQATFAFRRVDDHLESISISGCKFMELRGDYPRPVNEIAISPQKLLVLISQYITGLNKENNNIHIRYPWKDFPAKITASNREINASFLPWLEIAEPKFCFLVSSSPAEKILNMNVLPLPKGLSFPILYGLADNDSVCLINFVEEEMQTGYDDAKSFTLHVRNFSSSNKLAEHLVERIVEWDKTGRPDIKNAGVKAYLSNSGILPSKNEYLISKNNVSLLFSWKSDN